MIWALGGSLGTTDGKDYRKEFAKWFSSQFKGGVKMGNKSIFEYYFNKTSGAFEEWTDIIKEIDFDSKKESITSCFVPTGETVALEFFINRLINVRKGTLLIGLSGCGKTQLVKGILKNLNVSTHTSKSISLNFYTDSMMLQTQMENMLKKQGKVYQPPGNVDMI